MRHQRWQAPSDSGATRPREWPGGALGRPAASGPGADPAPRPSRQARLASLVTSGTLRPLSGLVPGATAQLWFSRVVVAGSLALFSPTAPGTRVDRVDTRAPDGTPVRGELVRGPGAVRDDAALLYLHGSAYAVASARTHRGLTSRLSAMTGLPVFAPDYRLAPRYRFPAAADDVRAAWEWLGARGRGGERIAVAGDSAGGHLAVDLALSLAADRRPTPAALALFSPLIDLSFALARRREQHRRDPLVSAAWGRRLLGHYVRDADRHDPRLAFEFAAARDFPPTLIQAGELEMLAADAEYLGERLAERGGRCEVQLWPGQMHVFQAMSRCIPEADLALGRAAAFLGTELAAAHPATGRPDAPREVS